MENEKINELVLLCTTSSEQAWKLFDKTGKHTLNHESHDSEKAIKAFYNVAPSILEFINRDLYENYSFERGERKEFAKALYESFMNE